MTSFSTQSYRARSSRRIGSLLLACLALGSVASCRTGHVKTPTDLWHQDAQAGALFFVDLENGWAGIGRAIYRTDDGGKLWSLKHTARDRVIALDFVDRAHGWAIAGSNLLRTTNGGRTWSGLNVGHRVTAVDFSSTHSGGAIVRSGGVIWTVDGGKHWTRPQDGTPEMAICATDQRTWIAENKRVLTKATNSPWVESLSAELRGEGEVVPRLDCSGKTAWVLFENGAVSSQQHYAVFRTSDAGRSWSPQLQNQYVAPLGEESGVTDGIDDYAGPFDASGRSAVFAGYSPASSKASITMTRDGGKNWSHRSIESEPAVPIGLAFATPDSGWVMLSNARHTAILHTVDAGKSWTQQLRVPRSRD